MLLWFVEGPESDAQIIHLQSENMGLPTCRFDLSDRSFEFCFLNRFRHLSMDIIEMCHFDQQVRHLCCFRIPRVDLKVSQRREVRCTCAGGVFPSLTRLEAERVKERAEYFELFVPANGFDDSD